MAPTSFIFVEYLDETGCFCLRLENDASVSAPFVHRSFDEIKTLQLESQTVIVLSTAKCGLHEVELPWLSDRKARAAIPYALEEHLAQKLTDLHFAFDHAHHQNNRYLVAVVDKLYLLDLISQLDAVGIEFKEITLDWFALKPGDVCLTASTVLARTTEFQGALLGELATTYLKTLPETTSVMTFIDTAADWKQLTQTKIDSSFFVWAAQRLQSLPRLNLCQGELSHGTDQEGLSRRWGLVAAALFGVWIFAVLICNSINIIRLNHQLNRVDEEIAVVYRQFFPGAQHVISPRFRINQLLNTGHARQDATVLWQLLDKLNAAYEPEHLTITQLEFKSDALSVMLKGQDFSILEALSNHLKQAQVQVTQTQAASHEDYVTATLELRL